MSRFKIDVDSEAITKKLERMGSNAPDMAEEIVKNLGTIAHKSARSFVPVDTGALKGSISLEITGGGMNAEAEIGSALDYAASVEYGTSSQAAQPFLQPAVEEARSQMGEVSKAVLNKHD